MFVHKKKKKQTLTKFINLAIGLGPGSLILLKALG